MRGEEGEGKKGERRRKGRGGVRGGGERGLQIRDPSDQAALEGTQSSAGVGGKAFWEVLLYETLWRSVCKVAG